MCVLAGCKTCHSTSCERNIALFGNNCSYGGHRIRGRNSNFSLHDDGARYRRCAQNTHTFDGNKDNHGSGGRNITAVPHRGNQSPAGPAGKAAIYEQIENLIWWSYTTVRPRLSGPLSKNDTGPRYSKRWRRRRRARSTCVIALMRR